MESSWLKNTPLPVIRQLRPAQPRLCSHRLMGLPRCPGPYTPVGVERYQRLLIGALVERGVAFIRDHQPGERMGSWSASWSNKHGRGFEGSCSLIFLPLPLVPPEEGEAGGHSVGQGGCLPRPGHDIVLLGLLVHRAAHAAILQGTLPGQLPLLLCGRTWERSCVLPQGRPALLLGAACPGPFLCTPTPLPGRAHGPQAPGAYGHAFGPA